VTFPHQLFINNEFVDASDGGTFDTICPYDEQVFARKVYAVEPTYVPQCKQHFSEMTYCFLAIFPAVMYWVCLH